MSSQKCPNCKTFFEIDNNRRYKKIFCSRSCSNKREHSENTKLLIGKSNSTERLVTCKICNNSFSKHDRRSNKYCSDKCKLEKLREHLTGYKLYKRKCSFKFNLSDYKNEFDFNLIKKYGWYKAKNRGNNLKGISRDHMLSIKEGFLNNIPTELIAHPANCKLIKQTENSSKYSKSSINIDELIKRINKWNTKYGVMI